MKSSSTPVLAKPPAVRARPGKYLDVDGVSIRYIEAGDLHPGPPLVMLHGYNGGADCWFPHPIPKLSEEFHIIAPDLPGHGYSGRMAQHTLESFASIMNHFLDMLGLDDVYLLGHSMGGQVAVALTAARPERIRALILVDATGVPWSGQSWRRNLGLLTDASARHVRMYPVILRMSARAKAAKEGYDIIERQPTTPYLKSLTMPTLIVWGSRDRLVPMEHGALMARLIPTARLAVIRGSGHMPYYQKPRQFARIVSGFLKKVAQEQEREDYMHSPGKAPGTGVE